MIILVSLIQIYTMFIKSIINTFLLLCRFRIYKDAGFLLESRSDHADFLLAPVHSQNFKKEILTAELQQTLII